VEKKTGIKTNLHNDANACALAEWKFGAGNELRIWSFSHSVRDWEQD